MLEGICRFVRGQHLLGRGGGVLVACSGGPDSTALLDLLVRMRDRFELRLRAAYVHHGLRPEAELEADHVRALARARDVPFDVVRVRVPVRASLQEAARNVRLDALARVARAHGLDRVALGHTMSDQAETVLMRVLRGTGPRGLAGILPRRGVFVRPLLGVGRAEIVAYLRERDIAWLSDASNDDRRFLRARLRRDVLPVLRRINPRIEEALARLADNAREERGDAVSPPLTRAHLRSLAELMGEPAGTRWLALPGRRVAEVRVVDSPPVARIPVELEVPRPGRYAVPGMDATFVLQRRRRGSVPRASGWFDPTALRFPLVLRTRRPGDRIRLERGSRKISDLLIDAKVPRRERDDVLLLCGGAEVLWVAGLRQAVGTRPAGAVGLVADVVSDIDPGPPRANNGGQRCDHP
jgi:tRNA(Ile)-lysidine synthase